MTNSEETTRDLVEELLPAAVKNGTFIHGDWDTPDDDVKIIPARTEKGYFAKSMRARTIELEKISGTHRPTGGHKPGTYAPGQGGDPVRPGTLKDRHESPDVRERIAEADAILIKAGDRVAPAPPDEPAPTPPAITGYCRHCGGALDPDRRSDSKFCSGAHRTAFSRREAQLDIARQAFKDYTAATRVQHGSIGVLSGSEWQALMAAGHVPFHYLEPAPDPTPQMSAMYAIRSNQVDRYLMARKPSVTANPDAASEIIYNSNRLSQASIARSFLPA
jgi:hypothetical protein